MQPSSAVRQPQGTGWTALAERESVWDRWRRPVFAVVLAAAVVLGLAALGRSSPNSTTPTTTTTADPQFEAEKAYCMGYATEHLDSELYKVGGQHWTDSVNSCLVKRAVDRP